MHTFYFKKAGFSILESARKLFCLVGNSNRFNISAINWFGFYRLGSWITINASIHSTSTILEKAENLILPKVNVVSFNLLAFLQSFSAFVVHGPSSVFLIWVHEVHWLLEHPHSLWSEITLVLFTALYIFDKKSHLLASSQISAQSSSQGPRTYPFANSNSKVKMMQIASARRILAFIFQGLFMSEVRDVHNS